MTKSISSTLAWLAMVGVLAGCGNAPGADGRYATNDRGRSNNRAEVPVPPAISPAVGIGRVEQTDG